MSGTDFRALCAELLTALDCYMMMDGSDTTPAAERTAQLMEAKRKCIAALDAEPVPAPDGGPSDHIHEIAVNLRENAFSREADARLVGNISAEDIADLCDATIARYSDPTPAPVPVAQRLPEASDCDEEQMCWFFFLLSNDPTWTMEHYTSSLCSGRSYWLPHWALPLPSSQPEQV